MHPPATKLLIAAQRTATNFGTSYLVGAVVMMALTPDALSAIDSNWIAALTLEISVLELTHYKGR